MVYIDKSHGNALFLWIIFIFHLAVGINSKKVPLSHVGRECAEEVIFGVQGQQDNWRLA